MVSRVLRVSINPLLWGFSPPNDPDNTPCCRDWKEKTFRYGRKRETAANKVGHSTVSVKDLVLNVSAAFKVTMKDMLETLRRKLMLVNVVSPA